MPITSVLDAPLAPATAAENLLASPPRAQELKSASHAWLSWDLTARQLCDLELLLAGGFAPLSGFLGRADYESVRDSLRLKDGSVWPMPVTLDVPEALAGQLETNPRLALRDPEGAMLAALEVSEIWRPDLAAEAEAVFGTRDLAHPGVAYLLRQSHPVYISGRLEGLQLPVHYDFLSLRSTPAELKSEFQRAGWDRVVAFQTRNPMHRAHFELTRRAAEQVNANLLLHPSVGMTKPGDVDHYTRVRCYRSLLERYPAGSARLSLLPLAMRMGGPREALWHALIRKNYGATHFIVGRDHAGPGQDSQGKPFYGPYAAQELVARYEKEIGIAMVPFENMVYVAEKDQYFPENKLPAGAKATSLSGTELRNRLAKGTELPAWFTFPEVERELRHRHPPRIRQGVTVFFTGLSGSGKSTIANALLVRLLEEGSRPVTLLDGDLVRKHLSSELGFSKEHRDLNILRIGYVASEITKNGGMALCAPIAPYDDIRKQVRAQVEPQGGFILVHVATPLEVCEQRDRKGLYAKARAGIVKQFTGISDPYEAPADAEITLQTEAASPGECSQVILDYLNSHGYLAASAS